MVNTWSLQLISDVLPSAQLQVQQLTQWYFTKGHSLFTTSKRGYVKGDILK